MALRGNLEDIPIGNILQMVFLEKKDGILHVKSGKNLIKIYFDSGRVLYAEQNSEIEERRLMFALIRNGYLTEEQWNEVQNECEKTLMPLFVILKKFLDNDIHSFLIRRQTQYAIFTTLQWKKGKYAYDPDADIKLDRKVFKPSDGEFLVMEGLRVIDEWGEIVKSLPGLDKNLCIVDGFEKTLSKTGYKPTDVEKRIISLSKKVMSLQDILDTLLTDVVEMGKAIVNLMAMELIKIETGKKRKIKLISTRSNWKEPVTIATIILLTLCGFYLRYVSTKRGLSDYFVEVNSLKMANTEQQVNNIANSVKYFYALEDKPPPNIEDLVQGGYLTSHDILDSWGRPFVFEMHDDSFMLFSNGPIDDPSKRIYYHGMDLYAKTD